MILHLLVRYLIIRTNFRGTLESTDFLGRYFILKSYLRGTLKSKDFIREEPD